MRVSTAVLPYCFVLPYVLQQDKFFRTRDDLVSFGRYIVIQPVAVLYFIEGGIARGQHIVHPWCRFATGCFHSFHRSFHTQSIPGIERSQLPAVAGFDRIVNFIQLVGYLRIGYSNKANKGIR